MFVFGGFLLLCSDFRCRLLAIFRCRLLAISALDVHNSPAFMCHSVVAIVAFTR